MPHITTTTTTFVSDLVENQWYLFHDWKIRAAQTKDETVPARTNRFWNHNFYERTKTVFVASKFPNLASVRLDPRNIFNFCVLGDVGQAERFAAEVEQLGLRIWVRNEHDHPDKVPFTNTIRFYAAPGRTPDWYQALLLLNRWNDSGSVRQEITDKPDYIEISWFYS